MLYWLLPRIFQTKLWSTKLATWHFWLGTLGILFYIIPIYVAGLTQGLMWRAMTDTGYLQYPDFVETVNAVWPLWWARVGGGVLYVAGIGCLAVNYWMTWQTRPAQYQVPVIQAAPLTKDYVDPPAPKSSLEGKPVLDLAVKVDRWKEAHWHRALERMPTKFTIWVTVAVLIASGFSLIPTFLIRSNVPTLAVVKPYTPLELLGRDIYVAEGCYNCHSQQIRPLFAETERYGDYSLPGEFIYDRPFQWGSRRIGPDLAREGGKQSSYWHWEHFREPGSMTEGSVMPAYPHLITSELNYSSLPARIKAVAALGAPYEQELTESESMARKQAKQIVWDIVSQGGSPRVETSGGESIELENTKVVALIAYLQRLGIDRYATEEAGDEDGVLKLKPEEFATLEKYRELVNDEALANADASQGRIVFRRTCGTCHKLFDDGGNVGPDLTGTRRWSLDYLLVNSIAPSQEIAAAYKNVQIMTFDGVPINGVVVEEDDERVVLGNEKGESVEVLKDDIDLRKTSDVSLMPAEQLDLMKEQEVIDLMKYLQSLEQVPLPGKVESGDPPAEAPPQ